ncbi:MAG: hypothetical protein R3Y47_12100 [Lachnospiraceae bacterium]
MRQSPNESIWGNINTCIEIALNIYEITAQKGEGIMVQKDTETILSEKALSLGTDDGDYITFDENTKDIPKYEILKHKLQETKELEANLMKEIEEIERDGKYRYPEYFGDIEKPEDMQSEVCRGIYVIADGDQNAFAVHNCIAEDYMSEMATDTGVTRGEYKIYDSSTACIPIFELSKSFDEVDAMIIAKDSLYATLQTNFIAYTEEYNELAPMTPIPDVEAPVNLYLASQCNSNSNGTVQHSNEQNEEYGEEVDDYGFEP